MLAGLVDRFLKKVRTAKRLFREDRQRLWEDLLVRIDRYVVHGIIVNDIDPPVQPEGMTFRGLSNDELRCLPGDSEEIRDEQKARFARFGFNEAYGVFCQGELAHVSWLITPEHEFISGGRVVGLCQGEAEITACVTLSKFRGRGAYSYAIRSLCQVAHDRGIDRIFMKTSPQNYASQRGILKAGLPCLGRTVRISCPLLGGVGVTFRGHRFPWKAVLRVPKTTPRSPS